MFLSVIVSFLLIGTCINEEPRCSRFEFEKNLLEMLVRMEFEINQTNQKLAVMKEKLAREVRLKEELDQDRRNTSEILKENMLRIQVLENNLAKETESREKMYREINDTYIESSAELKPNEGAVISDVPGKHICNHCKTINTFYKTKHCFDFNNTQNTLTICNDVNMNRILIYYFRNSASPSIEHIFTI